MIDLTIDLRVKNEFVGVKGVVEKFPDKLEKGVAKISTYTFDEEEDFMYNLRAARDGGGMFRMYTGKYVRLHINGQLMMSDTAMERITNSDFIEKANGRVLIAGLGVGLILEGILEKESVTEVVVLEKYQDVVDLVEPLFKHPKLKIICADVFEYDMPKEEKFDTIYFDIWATLCTSNLDEMRTLHAKYRRNKASKDSFMDSWVRDYLKRQKAKEARESRSYRRWF